MDPPWPTALKSALWYSQRELAYIEYAEYRDACSAARAAATTAAAAGVHNPILIAASTGGGRGSSHTLVFK
jgi:hypothetical protein